MRRHRQTGLAWRVPFTCLSPADSSTAVAYQHVRWWSFLLIEETGRAVLFVPSSLIRERPAMIHTFTHSWANTNQEVLTAPTIKL